jgi:signal transduction histidine kinase
VKVRGDAELLTQAVTNLIENALVHTPTGSNIGLSVKQTEGGVVMTVADDGPGIPIDERGKVLRRFYRLDASRHSPGAGLGLALVSAIATLHEAQLSLTDNCPGLRAEITFPDMANCGLVARNQDDP